MRQVHGDDVPDDDRARLPADRPLWAAVVVDGLAGGGVAVVFVMHHVVADGDPTRTRSQAPWIDLPSPP